MQNTFTEPLVKLSKKRSYVWFRFNGRLFMFTGGLNRKRITPAQKATELKALCKAWKYRLEHDYYNPITDRLEPPEGVLNTAGMTFERAIKFAREKKTIVWTKKTGQDYDSVIKYLLEAQHSLGFSNMLITDFRRAHYVQVLHQVQQTRKLSAKGFNKYKSYLSSLVGEMVNPWEILEANVVEGIKDQPAPRTIAHKPPTPGERITIMNCLKSKHISLYRFCAVLYATTIREKEILALQVRDIHLKESVIRIVPEKERGNSKVLNEREVVIPDSLLPVFVQLNVERFPKHFFIFSKGLEPGPIRTHSNTPTAMWRKIVKGKVKAGGLNIQKDLYGLKKLGGNDMVDLQKELLDLIKLPQKQMGHTNPATTEVYVTRHKELAGDLLKKGMKEL